MGSLSLLLAHSLSSPTANTRTSEVYTYSHRFSGYLITRNANICPELEDQVSTKKATSWFKAIVLKHHFSEKDD